MLIIRLFEFSLAPCPRRRRALDDRRRSPSNKLRYCIYFFVKFCGLFSSRSRVSHTEKITLIVQRPTKETKKEIN